MGHYLSEMEPSEGNYTGKPLNKKKVIFKLSKEMENNMEFNKIVERRCKQIQKVLSSKEKEYATGKDRFHNFKVAAEIIDCTPPQALLGMMSKHIYSVIDMLIANGMDPSLFEILIKDIVTATKDIEKDTSEKGRRMTFEYLDEKIGDTINYLILLEGLMISYIEYNTGKEV